MDTEVTDIIKQEEIMRDEAYCGVLLSLLNYVVADLSRKQRGFKIGVCTVLLVVSFITILRAVVDLSPIVFLKLVKDQAGGFDFQLTSTIGKPFVDGDVNTHFADPFDYPTFVIN